jgi:Ribbon-helix-helix domain
MRRTNVYLPDEQLARLRLVGERRGVPVALLIREAVDRWLAEQGVQAVEEDEWERRFDALLRRRAETARERQFDEERVTADVAEAVRDVRRAHAARRR